MIQGVARGSASVTVEGGIVRGTVRDLQFAPVAGAKLAITSGLSTIATESDADGHYKVVGVTGPFVAVKALKDVDPSTQLLGFATGFMNQTNGFIDVDIVLVEAGSISGPVFLADGTTSAGDGVKVELFAANNLAEPLATTFTVDGAYAFPLVALGKYTIDVSDTAGHRGRASAEIASSGQELTVPVSFLGSGSITVTVRDGAGNPVSGALVTVLGSSVFGGAPPVTGTAISGTITVQNVLFGSFTVQARDPATQLRGLGLRDAQCHRTERHGRSHARQLCRVAGHRVSIGRDDDRIRRHRVGVRQHPDGDRYAGSLRARAAATWYDAHPGSRSGHSRHRPRLGDARSAGTDEDCRYHTVPAGHAGRHRHQRQRCAGACRIDHRRRRGPRGRHAVCETDATGVAVVNNVIAGSFTVRAFSGILRGSTTGSLAPGEQKPVLVALQPTASIHGVVRAPNDAPVTEGTVTLDGVGGVTVPIGPDGTFTADGLVLGTYTLTARDAQNRLRARGSRSGRADGAQSGRADLVEVCRTWQRGWTRGRILTDRVPSACPFRCAGSIREFTWSAVRLPMQAASTRSPASRSAISR